MAASPIGLCGCGRALHGPEKQRGGLCRKCAECGVSVKITAGKYYKTRDGRKAYVDAVRTPNPFPKTPRPAAEWQRPAMGYLELYGETAWTTAGRWRTDGARSQLDLMTECPCDDAEAPRTTNADAK